MDNVYFMGMRGDVTFERTPDDMILHDAALFLSDGQAHSEDELLEFTDDPRRTVHRLRMYGVMVFVAYKTEPVKTYYMTRRVTL